MGDHVFVYYHDDDGDFLDVNTWKSALTELCILSICSKLYFNKLVKKKRKEACIKFNPLIWVYSYWFKCALSVCFRLTLPDSFKLIILLAVVIVKYF